MNTEKTTKKDPNLCVLEKLYYYIIPKGFAEKRKEIIYPPSMLFFLYLPTVGKKLPTLIATPEKKA